MPVVGAPCPAPLRRTFVGGATLCWSSRTQCTTEHRRKKGGEKVQKRASDGRVKYGGGKETAEKAAITSMVIDLAVPVSLTSSHERGRPRLNPARCSDMGSPGNVIHAPLLT